MHLCECSGFFPNQYDCYWYDIHVLLLFQQLTVIQRKEEEKRQQLEKRAQFKEKTKELLRFSAAEMAARERAEAKARQSSGKVIIN